MKESSCVHFDNIAHAAYLIDQEFDYDSNFSIGIEKDIRNQYGDAFYAAFSEYFSNCWHEVLGEAIMGFDFAEVFSMAVRHAAKTASVDLADTGNWDGEKKWKGDQLWSLASASLKDACGNEDLAEAWKESFLHLCTQQKIRKEIESSSTRDVAILLLHSFGRAHALIKQAIEWENPRIGREGSTSKLDTTRGIMWRYAIAYCGWDRCTNALGITQATQERLLAKTNYRLESPKLTAAQKRQIIEWIPEQKIIVGINNESIDGTWIRSFLGISDNYYAFPDWLLGGKGMKQAALLAVLRNVVCHGSLLPTKAKSWGLESVYQKGIRAISDGLSLLLEAIYTLP